MARLTFKNPNDADEFWKENPEAHEAYTAARSLSDSLEVNTNMYSDNIVFGHSSGSSKLFRLYAMPVRCKECGKMTMTQNMGAYMNDQKFT